MAAWAQAIATVIAALVGGFVSYFLLAQQRAKIHEKRLDAYARLWELTEEFRLNGPPIDSQRRQQLANELTKWYFQPGGGMLLTGRTLAMFIKVRANLTCDPRFSLRRRGKLSCARRTRINKLVISGASCSCNGSSRCYGRS